MLHLCYKPKVFKGYHPSIVRLLNAVFYFPIGREDVCGSSLCNRTQDRGDFSIPLPEGFQQKSGVLKDCVLLPEKATDRLIMPMRIH